MLYDDLGLISDKIVSVQRTAGTGQAGSLDTYTITTATGGSFQFQVQNGTNGNLVIKQEIFGGYGHTLSELTSWIDGNSERAKRIASMVYVDTSVNPCYICEVSYFLNLNNNTFKFFKANVSNDNQEYVEITSLGADSYIYVYYYDSVEASMDDSLNINSENAVTNRAITGSLAKPAGVYDTLASLTAAYPSGTTGSFLVETDGHWYYWDGAWTDGGEYLNVADSELSENSINAVQNKKVTAYIDNILKDKVSVQENPSTNNLFNKDNVIVGYFDYTSGSYNDTSNYRSSDYIPCEQNTYYGLNSPYSHVTFWNIRHKFVGGFLVDNNNFVFQTPNDAAFIIISINYSLLNSCMLAKGQVGSSALQYEPYKSYTGASKKFSLFDYNKYQFAYIKDRKLICNKVDNSLTAIYTGIECKIVPNEIKAKVIWEDISTKTYKGEIALISNPNGLHNITNITDKSLHLEVAPSNLALSLMDKNLNATYGKRVLAIYQQLSTPLVCDGKTEHNIVMSWTNTNVHIVIDNMTFDYNVANNELKDIDGTTVATGTINDYTGKYCTFEHYVARDRDDSSMPMYKAIEIKGNGMTRIRDWFEREDSALSTTPTGENYIQISNAFYNNDVEW